jgi:large subunit ribosomal protein L24
MARHVRKGDTVMVMAGDEKGKTGQVLRVDPGAGTVLIQGINRVYKHVRPSRKHMQGGRIQKEMPVRISNVLPLDPKTQQPTRVKFRQNPDGSKERVSRKSDQALGLVRKKTE